MSAYSLMKTKTKKLTNLRASGHDEAVSLTPVVKPSLEQAIQFIAYKLMSIYTGAWSEPMTSLRMPASFIFPSSSFDTRK